MKFGRFLLILLIVGLLTACGAEAPDAGTTAPATEPTLQTEPVTETAGEIMEETTEELPDLPPLPTYTEPTAPQETLGIAVETPYITLYYPEEWEGRVEAVQTTEGRNHVVSFRTEISGKEVVLFSVILGRDAAQGYLLGRLDMGNSGMINVYSAINEMDPGEWPEEDYREICALQERVNDILAQFQADERFKQ